MKCVKFLYYLFFSVIFLLVSCENINEENNTTRVKASDLQVTMQENPLTGAEIGTIPVSASGGNLLFKLLHEVPSGAFAINDTSGYVTVANAALYDFETNPTLAAAVIVENGSITDTATVTVALINVNEVSGTDLSVTIAENPAEGFEIGFIQGQANEDNTSFSFLSQNPANAFGINPNTGRVHVGNSQLFDFEINPSLSASVLISNGGELDTASVLVSLTDIVEVSITAADFDTTIAENPTNGQSLGFLMADANTDSLDFYFISQSPVTAMNLNPNTGELTVNDSSLFDFEQRTSLTAEAVVAHKESQVSDTLAIVIQLINDVNEAYLNSNDLSKNIGHPILGGANIIVLHDHLMPIETNLTSPILFEIVSQSHQNAFKYNNSPTNNNLYVNDKSVFDFHQEMSVTIKASSSGRETTFTLTFFVVHPTDNFEIDINDYVGSMDENPPFQNFVIGQLSGTVTGTNIVHYKMIEQSPNLSPKLLGIGLLNRHLHTGLGFAQIDYENIKQITGKIEVSAYAFSVTSGYVKKDTVDFTINVNDVFEAKLVASGFETTIPENPVNGAVIGAISATTDTGNIVYTLENSTPAGAFAVDANTGVVSVADSSLFDYELQTELHLNVTVSVETVQKNAHVTVFLTNEIDAVQDRLNNGETPFQIYNSDNSLLGEIQGSYYQGGFIAYLNLQDGSGLVAYPTELSPAGWGCDSTLTEATATNIYQGKINTNIILNSSCTDTIGAAFIADDLEFQGYTDWHLPSRDELLAVFLHVYLKDVGNMLDATYWTSTEADQFRGTALSFNKSGHSELSVLKTSNLMRVRPVRYFTEPLAGSKRN